MTAMTPVTNANQRNSVSSDRAWNVRPAATPPAADATSSSMPSRRLIRLRPAVLTDTTLDVAMTVIRLVATAILIGSPMTVLRNGTRKTPPPMPSSAPRPPATAPAAITTAMVSGVMIKR